MGISRVNVIKYCVRFDFILFAIALFPIHMCHMYMSGMDVGGIRMLVSSDVLFCSLSAEKTNE